MTTLKVGGSTPWFPILLISLLFLGGVYFYKDHQLKQAIQQYEAQQTFLKEQVAKFGVIDSQFEEILSGRSITLVDIENSQKRVQDILSAITQLEVADSIAGQSTADSIQLQEALDILGL